MVDGANDCDGAKDVEGFDDGVDVNGDGTIDDDDDDDGTLLLS